LPVRQHDLERVDLGMPTAGLNLDTAGFQHHSRRPADLLLRVSGRLGCDDGL
jgi:hypothetical protein